MLHLHALPMALMALKDARYEPARIAAVDAVRVRPLAQLHTVIIIKKRPERYR